MHRRLMTATMTAVALALGVTLAAQPFDFAQGRRGGQRGPAGGPPPGDQQGRRGGRPGGPGPCDPAVLKQQLNMTAEQAAWFDRIRQIEMDASKPILEELHTLLGDGPRSGNPPSRDVQAKVAELNKQLQTIRDDAHSQVVQMLTPEQQQKLESIEPPQGRGRRGPPPDGSTPPPDGQRGPRRGGPGRANPC